MCRTTKLQVLVLGHEISKYLGYLVLILSFLEGLIEAYKASLVTIMPFLFANDNTHYSRWGTVHLNDMLFLQESNPDVYREF